ncbi:hypothetical protein QS257_16690 [Terrilactibacillus sp. S3-3]|nr:hypothetical protein QS257_16690 [Terrilactibacillus sp. S3-3]
MSIAKEDVFKLFDKLTEDEKKSTYNYVQFLSSLNVKPSKHNKVGKAVLVD